MGEKKQKKVKVVYDVDGKMKKSKNNKKNKNNKKSLRLKRGNIVAVSIFIVVEALVYYFITPPINIHVGGFWVWLFFSMLGAMLCTMDFRAERIRCSKEYDEYEGVTKLTIKLLYALGIFVVLWIVAGISSSAMFRARSYAGVIEITEGNFSDDIPVNEPLNNIALMDTDTARIIGERAVGSLSDVVSQYEVSDSYSTIDYNGIPMKVAPLEYAGFFKYMNNKKDGIPGYVLVDPVKNEAQYIKLDKPMKYSPSAFFGKNLQRHVQFSYPTKQFEGFYFEIDNEGKPYYICPVLKPQAGLFGAKDVAGVVLCDPCTGDCDYMSLSEVPSWVDRVYDGDLACRKYNWYGNYSGGFINSIFGNKGCKQTTDDYGYKVMDGDVWVYTGVTSVNGDQSNIGFIMMNSRTAESKYFSIAGAEEHSAMSSAEGQVQNLGYTASFPTLINVDGAPTYIMVLKDNAGLVKMYALVNMEKYNIVATSATEKDAMASYKKLLVENGIISGGQAVTEDSLSSEIEISDIKYILNGGETYVYITDKDGAVYKQNFSEDETLIFLNAGDKISVIYEEGENGIKEILSHSYDENLNEKQ